MVTPAYSRRARGAWAPLRGKRVPTVIELPAGDPGPPPAACPQPASTEIVSARVARRRTLSILGGRAARALGLFDAPEQDVDEGPDGGDADGAEEDGTDD